MPTSPHTLAGMRIEPPPSLPCANGTSPAATAAPGPAAGPAGGPARVPRRARRRRDHGLGVAGQAELRGVGLAEADRAGPARAARPRGRRPAARTARTPGEPRVVRTPAVRLRSLIAVGTPNSGGSSAGSSAATRASASLACSRAASSVTVTNAPSSSLRRCSRARWWSTSSTGLTSRRRTAPACSRAVRSCNSAMTDLIAARVGQDVGVADALSREYAEELDRSDPLAGFRDRFVRPEEDLRYLDGNSLGRLPRATVDRLATVVDRGVGPRADPVLVVLDRAVPLGRRRSSPPRWCGARPGEVVVVRLHHGQPLQAGRGRARRPAGADVVLGVGGRVPDGPVRAAGAVLRPRALTLRSVPTRHRRGALGVRRAGRRWTPRWRWSACPTWRTGPARWPTWRRSPRPRTRPGALVLWDLSHSGGSVPVDAGARPAPTWRWAARTSTSTAGRARPPTSTSAPTCRTRCGSRSRAGSGRVDQFGMGPAYEPAPGIDRFLVGTPPILARGRGRGGRRG